jgi:hypothetical protein
VTSCCVLNKCTVCNKGTQVWQTSAKGAATPHLRLPVEALRPSARTRQMSSQLENMKPTFAPARRESESFYQSLAMSKHSDATIIWYEAFERDSWKMQKTIL